jgi:polar amino acid transport system ATP-binding protein
VGIARALALNPELLLLDEPTSALDPERVEEVLDVIRDLAGQGMTMVMVTHEMAFAAHISSRLVFMADGNIIESGTPRQIFTQPKSERLRAFSRRCFVGLCNPKNWRNYHDGNRLTGCPTAG